MTNERRASTSWYVLVASLVAAACSRTDPPRPNASAAPSATPATAVAPAIAAPSTSDASNGKAFGAACVDDAECGGGVCFHKRIKTADAGHERRDSGEAVEHDGYCSIHCSDDDDCPVPMTKGKCGARGMCKRSD